MKKSLSFLTMVLIAALYGCSGGDDKFNPETDWVEITVNDQLNIHRELEKLADKYRIKRDDEADTFFRNLIIKGDISKLTLPIMDYYEQLYNLDLSQTKLDELFYSVIPAKIKWVAFPETLKDMHAAFAGCDNLEEMVIPKNIVSIHDYNFEKLSILKTVVVDAPTPPNILYACELGDGMPEMYPKIYPSKAWKLIVPKGSKADYEAHEWWGRFTSIDEK